MVFGKITIHSVVYMHDEATKRINVGSKMGVTHVRCRNAGYCEATGPS